jgi:hypothetical protein
MALIGSSPVSRDSERGYPPHDESNGISAADFDRIAANMRQCSIFPGKGPGAAAGSALTSWALTAQAWVAILGR